MMPEPSGPSLDVLEAGRAVEVALKMVDQILMLFDCW